MSTTETTSLVSITGEKMRSTKASSVSESPIKSSVDDLCNRIKKMEDRMRSLEDVMDDIDNRMKKATIGLDALCEKLPDVTENSHNHSRKSPNLELKITWSTTALPPIPEKKRRIDRAFSIMLVNSAQ
ncbi:hypothetical protein L9F63_011989 [Diploptera punctata]|uniref:Uncharacterized protein n=1 Tax=Diploptera punctata TaxID=6984 RepID=A0AAD8ADE1_DIPPU|nr:hypothetical protein L9F63_011989 [Diploptera punctata]